MFCILAQGRLIAAQGLPAPAGGPRAGQDGFILTKSEWLRYTYSHWQNFIPLGRRRDGICGCWERASTTTRCASWKRGEFFLLFSVVTL